ncbi:hypothetical protein M3P21_16350 [Ruegeria sp. 2012CJ41-6]|uniref:Uncharacterized protein n=1 Tax=Ruegeria spongiae TaxID=2942209 RepID=A0ABT0Q6B8_9RHOB|nr:hypothetical protein [Ruegeria spongiae]MCL6285102.1 hypothetical protein [Ruegeria spongiae]
MSPAGGYPIEEFLEAITAQLDQTQDALRLKAVNRPLTFALKDFNVDLKVFVEMDQAGRVTFRPAAPNEEGASTVSIGFTTITRPMIEENTISMEMANAPTLDELGLAPDERRQLARVGVRNAAQLRNLERNAGDEGLSRHSGINLGRIRGALNLARPRLSDVVDPETATPEVPMPDSAAPDLPPPDVPPQPGPPTNGVTPPQPDPTPPAQPGGFWPPRGPLSPVTPQPEPKISAPVGPGPEQSTPPISNPIADRLRQRRRKLAIKPDARNIELRGNNLTDGGRLPVARLDGQNLNLLTAKPSSVSFSLPQGWAMGPGRLIVEMPDGEMEDFDLTGGSGT